MSDRQKILDWLRTRGAAGVTSKEIRTHGLSGNPSQRINELRDQGHAIEAEDYRIGRRKFTTYKLVQPSTARRAEVQPLGRRAVEPVAPQPPVHRATPAGSPWPAGATLFDVEGLR